MFGNRITVSAVSSFTGHQKSVARNSFTPGVSFTLSKLRSDATTGSLGAALIFAALSFNAQAAAPLAVDDTFNTGPGQAISGSLSFNDSGLDGPTDTYALQTNATNGTAVVNADSSFTYTPNIGYAGTDTFTYTIDDGAGGNSTATVSIEVAGASNFLSAASTFIIADEDTSIPLGLSVAPDLFNGGALQDLISSDNQFRAADAGGTPIVSTVPSNATSITITGYSTQSRNTAGADDTDDDYQLLNARIDLVTGTSSGQVAFLNHGNLSLLDQYSWESVPLGNAVLADPSKVIGFSTNASNPVFSLSANKLQIVENHQLETAYIIEYMTSNGDSTNFIRAGNTVQTAGESVSELTIPTDLQPASGKHGVIIMNGLSAAAGTNFAVEHKGFSRLVIDLDTMLISGSVAAQQGETENNTVTYSFRDYPLIDQRINSSTPLSILSSNASIIGDTTAKPGVRDDVTVYINTNGELTIERAADFAAVFTSMYTSEFYARTGFSSIASFVSVGSDDALFDASPADDVDNNGKPVNELRFAVPASAQVGIFRVSWNTIGGNDTNENIGMGFAVVDLANGVSSGSTTFIRASTPDLVSWDAVPFGTTFFGATDSAGNPLYQSNKVAGTFTDGYGETARFTLINNADGSRELLYTATSVGGTQNFRDYQGNGHISWLGNEPFAIEGIPLDGALTAGSPLPNGDWEIDFSDLPTVEYIPVEHFSGQVPIDLSLSSTGETLSVLINVEPVVDGIDLVTTDVSGYENTPLAIPVTVTASPDTDGSEPPVSTYQLDNIPATVTLASGSGVISDIGGGSWQADSAAISSLTATGTAIVNAAISVTAVQIDQLDIDSDSSIEDTDNGASVDEYDEQSITESFNLSINAAPTVDSLLVNNGNPTLIGTAAVGAGETLTVTVNGVTYTAGDGNLTVNADDTWTLIIPAADTLPENTYSVTATLTHNGGASASDTSTDELIVDLTPPPAPGVTSQTTTNSAPVISGTTASSTGTTLSVSVNGVLYTDGDGNLTDNGDGTWDLTIPAANAIPDGVYQVVATLTDAAGNQSSDPGIDDMVIDTTAPSTPGVTSLVINNSTPVIEGTAQVAAGETLTVTVNGITYTDGDGNLTDNGDNTWTLQIPVANTLPEASYDVTASVTDIAGNVSSDPSSGELIVDLTAPVAPTVNPALVNITTPTITGGATVAAGEILTVTVNGVSYTDGDGALTDNTDGTWTLVIPAADALAEAVYNVDALISDAAGNSTSDITASELTVDLTPPPAPTVVSQITNNPNPVINGTAVVAATDTLSVTVGTATYTAPDVALVGNNWSLTIPTGDDLAEQTYSVTATVTDAAGNSADDITSDELIVDVTPPPAPGVTSQVTMNPTPLVSGTMPVSNGLILMVEVNGIVYTAGDGNLTDNNDGTWELQIPAADTLADALYQVVASLTDAAGNISTDPGVDELLVDTTAPAAPGVTSLTTNTGTPAIEGTASLSPGDVLTVTVNGITYTDGDGFLTSDTTADTWTLAIPPANTLPEALYSVVATITDAALNTSSDPSNDELLIDLTAPAVPAVISQETNNPTPVITGTATVLPGELLTVTVNGVTYTVDDGNLVDNSDGTWDLTIPAADSLPEGTLDVTATVADAAGNSVSDSTTAELLLDFTPPPIPTVNALLTNNDAPIITGTATVSGNDTLSVTVNGIVYNAGDGNLIDNADGTWSLAIPAVNALTENTYEVITTVTDQVGNAAVDISSNELIVDLTPPPAAGVTSQTTTNSTPVISGTTTVGTGLLLQVTVNAVVYTAGDGNLIDNGDGTWDLTIPTANTLPDALYQVTATLTDAAGNSSTDPGSDELLVDTTAPPSPGVTSLTTNLTSPTIEGTAIVNAGETLTVTVNGVTHTAGDGYLIDNVDGTWTLAIPVADALAENTYEVTATVTDIAGNASTDPSTDELLIDTTAPVAPTADSLITNNTTPALSGTATVGNGETLTVTVNGITYTAGDGNLVDNGDGTWILVIPAADTLPEGPLDVSVVVTDAAGNSAADASTSELTIDLTPPAIPTVVSLLTNNVNPVISGTATLTTIDTLSVTVDGVTYTAGDSNLVDNADGTWDLTIPAVTALAENTYDVTATVTDNAGNTADDATANELIVDLTPPPAPGVTSQTTMNTTPVISGTTAVGTGMLLQVTVNAVVYTAGDGNLVDHGDGTWDLTIPATNALTDNLYQVTATLTDAAGNTSTDPGIDELLVDTTAPPSPGVTSLTTNLTSPTIEGTAIVNAGETLTVTVNGVTYTAVDGNLTDNADGTWTLAIPAADALAENTYEVTATVTDIAGNTSTDPSTDELLIDTTAPVSPTADTLVTNNTTPTITGTATVGSGETLTVAVDGTTYTAGDGDLIDNTDGTWALAIPAALAESVFDVSVIVTDAAGNSSADTTTDELTIDLTSPATPTITIAEDSNNDALISQTEPAGDIDLMVTLPVDAGVGDTLQATDGTTVLSTMLSAADINTGSVSYTLPAGTDGLLLNVDATVTDVAGNTSPAGTDTALLDFSPPSAPQVLISEDSNDDALINIAENSANDASSVDIAIFLPLDVNAGDTLDWSVNGSNTTLMLSAVHVVAGVINVTTPNTFTDTDIITVTAQLTDEAGNTSVVSTDEAEYDLTAPLSATVVSQITNNVTPVIEGTASVNAGDTLEVTVNSVTYIAGDGNLIDNGDGTWTLTIPSVSTLTANVFDVTVSVTDSAGNTATDTSASELTIDLTPPAVPMVNSLATNNVTPAITGDALLATDDVLTVGVNGITYTDGDGNLSTTAADTWTLSIPAADALAEATYEVTAVITDAAGNSSTDITTFELTVDLTAPAVPTVTPLLTNNTTPVLIGTATLSAADTLSVSVNGITYIASDGNLTDNADGTWSLMIPATDALAESTYEVMVSSTDPVGNAAVDTTAYELIVDLTPPPAPGVTSQTTMNPTPVISGTTAVGTGMVLQVTVNTVVYTAGDGSLVDNGDGTWDLTIPATNALADNLYQVTATLTDAAGNTSTDPGIDELLVDTTAPPSPGVTSLTTNLTSPTIEGTAIVNAGETLTVTVNGVTYTASDGNLTDNVDGTWTLAIPAADALAENTYEVTATVTDIAGNTSTDPSTNELLVDTTAPVSPTADTLITNNTAPTISGTATTGAGETLTVAVDGTTYTAGDGDLIDNADGTWALAIPAALAESIFEVSVIVTDAAGNSSADTTTNELTIDLTSPATPAVTPLITNTATPSISGTATLLPGEVPSVSVNGIDYIAGDGNLIDNGDGTWTLTIPATASLTEGNYDVTAAVTDLAGNSSTDTTSAELTVDLTAPAIPSVTTLVTNLTTPVLNGLATVQTGETLSVTVNGVVYTNGDGNLVDNGDGTWILTIPAADILAESTFDVVASITDIAGNASVDISNSELTIDLTAPVVPTVTPLLSNINTPALGGSAVVGNGDTLTVTVNGVTYSAGDGNLTDNADGTWTLAIPAADALAENTYEVTATVTDIAGNTSTDPSTDELLIDTTAPAAPTADSLITNNTSPVLSGTATVGSGETLAVTVNGITYTAGDGNLVDNGDGTWTLTIPAADALPEGPLDVSVVVTDAAGNSAADASSSELTIDLTPPPVPTVESLLTNNVNPVISGTATLSITDTLSVTVDGVTYTAGDGNLVDNAEGTWDLTIPTVNALAENTYEVTAIVTDNAGNTADDTTANELIVDLTPPPAPGVTSQTTMNTTPIISGTTAVGTGMVLQVTVNDVVYTAGDGPLVDNGNGTWDLTIPATNALTDDLYQVTATLTDAAGNTSTDPGSDELLVDTTAPPSPGVTSLTTNLTSPTIEGTAIVNAGETLTVTVNGVTYTAGDGNLTDNADGTWTLAIPAANTLAENTYEVTATVIDTAGNQSVDPSTNELLIDTTAPESPTADTLITNNTTPTITGTATVENGETLTVAVDGTTYTAGVGHLVANADGTWTLAIPAVLAESVFDVSVTVTDAAGNSSADTTTNELTIDLTPPIMATADTLVTSVSTPFLTGTASYEPGSILTITVDGISYSAGNGNLTFNSNGEWTLQVTSPMAEGQYDIFVVVTDAAGNSTTDNSIDELTVDQTAPPVPTVLSVIDSNTTPTITGTATVAPGDTLTVIVNGVTYTEGDGNLTIDNNGNWTLHVPNPLPEGSLDVVATITDSVGNSASDNTSDELVIDITPPPAPSVASLLTNNTTPTISGTAASDTAYTMTIEVDGNSYTTADGQLVHSPDNNWTLAIPANAALPESKYEVLAIISDTAGNTATDNTTLELTVDLTPPAAPGVTSMSSQTGTPVIAGTWVPEPGVVLTVEVNGVVYTAGDGQLSVDMNGAWTLIIPTIDTLADALYEVLAVTTDAAGNTNTDPGTDELLIDSIAPQIPGVTSLTTNQTAPVLYGTVVVETGEQLEVTVNGITYVAGDGHLTLTSGDTWSLAIPSPHALAEGHYDVTAQVFDTAGNTSSDPSSGELLIDTTAPDTATVVSQLTNDSTPVVTGLASPGPGETLTVTINGVTYTAGDGVLIDNSDGTWQLSLPTPLPDGAWDVMVSVIDQAGNQTDSLGSLLIDTMQPSITVAPDTTDATYTPALTGSTDQPDGSIVEVTNASGSLICAAIVQDNAWQCIPESPLNDGTNQLTASITDAAGNTALISFDVPIDDDFDGDGILNAEEGFTDHDDDGIADWLDLDTDNDGIPDATEGNTDTDNDGIADYRDRDADNDGIADVIEAGAVDTDSNFILDTLVDTDSNGLADLVQSEPLALHDTDYDGLPNYIDVDSDQDGIPDLIEIGGSDEDNDGRIDNPLDLNNDGIDDAIALLPFAIAVSDNDGSADYLDVDSDADGLFDLTEAGGQDLDGNGIVDSMTDNDQDAIPDSVDVTYTLGEDADGDGIDDRMDISALTLLNDAPEPIALANDSATAEMFSDSDGDGIADRFDPDSNGDGYADTVILALTIGMALPDVDQNGTPDFQQAGVLEIHTGLRGYGGCSLSSRQSVDPSLAIILLIALAGAGRRRKLQLAELPNRC